MISTPGKSGGNAGLPALLLLPAAACGAALWTCGPAAALFTLLGAAAGAAAARLLRRAPQEVRPPRSGEPPLSADEAARRYRLLTENLAAAVIIRDAAGRIIYCSPFTEVLTGYSLSEIHSCRGDFFLTVVHDDDREKYQRALRVSACGEAFQLPFRLYHKSGIEMWAEMRTVPVLDKDGAVTSSLSIALDMTGTMRYQRLVEEKNRDLQDFTYMVTHDLKAPILTIKGMLGLINEDLKAELTPGFNEPLEHISRAVRRLEQLVAGVLEYSKLSIAEAPLEAVDLNAVMDEVSKDFAPQAAAGQIELTISSGLPSVIGSRMRLYQIFSNLIGNAVKYRSPERRAMIEVSLLPGRNPRQAQIAVKDNGLGIPQNRIQDIFRPFQRAHGADIEGSGIGLACVKKLLEKIGGSVSVESAQDRGSTFTVTLKRPAAEA